MHVAELWRYPVKSMRGEPLSEAEVGRHGIPGDRIAGVRGRRGLLTGRTRPRLLGLAATVGPGGEPLIDGRAAEDEQTAAALRAAAGPDVALVPFAAGEGFDDTPLLVATDGAIAAFSHDGRRLRPNIVVAGVEGLAERQWPGARLRAGEVVIAVDHLCERCSMTIVDPDSLERDPDVLRFIRDRFGGELALNCSVVEPGRVRVGDPVELLSAP